MSRNMGLPAGTKSALQGLRTVGGYDLRDDPRHCYRTGLYALRSIYTDWVLASLCDSSCDYTEEQIRVIHTRS